MEERETKKKRANEIRGRREGKKEVNTQLKE